jgi:hypothetical protein
VTCLNYRGTHQTVGARCQDDPRVLPCRFTAEIDPQRRETQVGLNRGAGERILASMKRRPARPTPPDTFETVRMVGLALPDVEATTKYDGSPVLKVRGCFMAGLATHRSAEPETLVVRASVEERQWLMEDAPETYYLTDYYRRYPIVLVRLSRVDRDALRDLLSVSWRLAAAKAGRRRRS